MKVLHISTSDDGGAGLAAYRLHQALLSKGVESRMLVEMKTKNEDAIAVATPSSCLMYQPPKNRILRKIAKRRRAKGLLQTRYEKIQQQLDSLNKVCPNVFYTSPVSVYDLSSHPWLKEADVIHLHWVQNFLNFDDFFDKVNKPIVWTLHDLNPMFGGFHHVRHKEKYYDVFREIEDEFYNVKRKALCGRENLSVVAISSKMHQLIASHEFFMGKPIYDVYNSVDGAKFNMIDKDSVRKALGIPSDKTVFLFANRWLNDEQKGLSVAINALRLLDMENIMLLCVGDGEIGRAEGVEVRRIAAVKDSLWLSQLYSAADFLLLPSFQEGFSQTVLEAMCCGTPVIMTPVSGSDDIITIDNGVCCNDFSANAMCDAIRLALTQQYDGAKIRQNVIERFSPDIIANQYLNVYSEALRLS